MGRFIPGNPSFIVQNMPGVGSLIAVNHVSNVAAKDGTVIGAINPSAVTAPLFHPEQAKFDARRLNWLGTPVTIAYTIVAWHTAPVQHVRGPVQDRIAGRVGRRSFTHPADAGQRRSGNEVQGGDGLQERGRQHARHRARRGAGQGGEALSNLKAVHANYLRDKTLRIIGTYALKPEPELAGVPMVMDFAKTDEQRAALRLVLSSQDIGWPYMMAPDVPADRVAAMRSAFDATMKDPEFLADAAKRKLDIRPIGGEEQTQLIVQTLVTRLTSWNW